MLSIISALGGLIGIYIIQILLFVVIAFVSRENDIEMPTSPTFREGESEADHWVLRYLRVGGARIRSHVANYSRSAMIGLFGLLFLVSASPLLIPSHTSQVLFVTASILAAISFHLFSIGNTVHSVAESLGEPSYIEDGIRINGNATMIIASAGSLVIIGILYNVNLGMSGVSVQLERWLTAFSIAVVNVVLVIPGLALHERYHRWRDHDEDPDGGLKQALEAADDPTGYPEKLHSEVEELSEAKYLKQRVDIIHSRMENK